MPNAAPAQTPPQSPLSVRKAHLAAAIARRKEIGESRAALLEALARGKSHAQIADMIGVEVSTVRRKVRDSIAARAPLPMRDHAAIQILRLERAVRTLDVASALGDWRAAAALPNVVQALDRYHVLAEAAKRAEGRKRALSARKRQAALAAPSALLTGQQSDDANTLGDAISRFGQ